MWHRTLLVIVCLTCVCGSLAAGEEGLVGYWKFDQQAGVEAEDSSGQENIGEIKGATFVKAGVNYALSFDGIDDFVDCGADIGPAIEKAATIEFWCKSMAIQGALVNWSPSGRWEDQRLFIGYVTYDPNNMRLLVIYANGEGYGHAFEPALVLNVWTHVVLTYDGKTMCTYQDGKLLGVREQRFAPTLKGVPLQLGTCNAGMGKNFYKGLLDEVRIYSRALTAEEVLAAYNQNADTMRKDNVGGEVKAP